MINQAELQGHPAEALPLPLANFATCPWILDSELPGAVLLLPFWKLLSVLLSEVAGVSLGKVNLLF